MGKKDTAYGSDSVVTQCPETYISTNIHQSHALNKSSGVFENSQALTDIAAKNAAHIRARTKRLNIALIGSHIAVVLGIIGVIALGYRAPVEASATQATFSVLEQETTTVDQIAAANVASVVAQTLSLPVENNVQNLAVSLNAKNELAQTDTSFLTKPQLVTQSGSRKGISEYITKDGDTVQSVAAAFGVSEDSVRWGNDLTSDALRPGITLKIPGTTGVIYTVKAGDDVAKLAEIFRADRDRIITFNDLELSGLQPGAQIVIPDGILPEDQRPGYTPAASSGFASSSFVTSYGGSGPCGGYAVGYCTCYAFSRRAELGRPIGNTWGNAASWAYLARASGYQVNNTPAPGAIMQHGGGWGGLGHVAVVEEVRPDGSILVSEMNYAGWNVISERTIPASSVRNYSYIH